MALQASSGLMTTRPWHTLNWAACPRQGRSLQRRIVQAGQAGAWRTVKRLRSRLVHAFAARAFAGNRVPENPGRNPPGVAGDRWDTPEKNAQAIARMACWQRYRPLPWQRIYSPKKKGQRRPLSIPAMVDRARQALYLQAVQPIAATVAAPNSYGLRPKRQCADAIDQCLNVLRQSTSATWVLEGASQGFCDNM